ncbi:glycosyltransferase [Vibrio viridaestus]|uniref:Colanic acid biosynthesis glycosyltransferase WcaL n=1 Tax=Vibrio viridaestus TaxID=2487322 RepID=A0A3N9TIG1_9VIBR|nr:glycosyltransferase [Vibrio viridaestus]RQW63880.1 colanic acid biosynthesis glycosyltransferase WcaL [Vibrio viridaestus]
MKVAIHTNQFPVLSETFIIDQVISLKKAGIDVVVFTQKLNNSIHQDKMKDIDINNDIIVIGSLKLKPSQIHIFMINILVNIVCYWKALIGILFTKGKFRMKTCLLSELSKSNSYRNINVHISHFGDVGIMTEWMKLVGKIEGDTLVYFHGADMSNTKALESLVPLYKKYLFSSTNKLLPISDYWRNKLVSWGANPERVSVQHMGVNINLIPESTRKRRVFEDCINIIQVGRLIEKKAILDSIKAVIQFHRYFDVKFLIVGDGPLRKEAEFLIEENNASSYIKLIGEASHEAVSSMLSSSDVFLLPSVTATNGDQEGIPVALMEAMLHGLVVVSTYHSGIPELVQDKINGFLVDEHSLDGITEALSTIKNLSGCEIDMIRANAINTIKEKFDSEDLSSTLIKHFLTKKIEVSNSAVSSQRDNIHGFK